MTVGTDGGFKKFCRGEIDVADASRPILKEEMALCQKNGIRYYELPIAFDAVTVCSRSNDYLGDVNDGRRTEEDLGTSRAGLGY